MYALWIKVVVRGIDVRNVDVRVMDVRNVDVRVMDVRNCAHGG